MKIKKKKEDIIFQIFFLVFSLVFIVFLVFSNLKIEKKKKELRQTINDLKLQIQQMEEKKKKLEEAMSQVEKESYLENLARQEGYVREGEGAIVIKKIENEQDEKKGIQQENFWLKIFKFFKK